MAKLKDITHFLDETFAGLVSQDFSNNGLQVDSGVEDIKCVAFAVDACQWSCRTAQKCKAQLLFVHHGLSWGGGVKYINGFIGQRVALLMKGGVSLYACHLPLDAHPVYGNNAVLARMLDLQDVKPFYDYHGAKIGCYGQLPRKVRVEKIASVIKDKLGVVSRIFSEDCNPKKTVGVVSGGGDGAIYECAELGINCLLTGEFRHQYFHDAMEMELSIIAAGHYATETTGVSAIMELIGKTFDIETCFLDHPTEL